MGHHRGDLDQGFDPAQALGQGEDPQPLHGAAGGAETALELERDHAPEALHLAPRQRMLRVAGKARIVDPLHPGVALEEAGHRDRIALVLAHAYRQRLQSTKHEPRIHGTGDAAHRVLQVCQPLAQVLPIDHQHAADGVAVAAEVLGRAVDHDVGAQRQRALEERAHEGVVHHYEGAVSMRDGADGADVHQLQPRVGGSLDPDHPGLRRPGRLHRFGPGGVDEAEGETHRLEHLLEESIGSPVEVVHGNGVVGGSQKPHDGRLGRHARGEGQAVAPALERGDAGLQRGPGRVAGPRILVAAVLAQLRLGIGGRLEDGNHDRPGRRLRLLAGVNGPGREAGLGLGHREVRACAMNSRRSSRVMMPTGRAASITTTAVAPPSRVLKASSM